MLITEYSAALLFRVRISLFVLCTAIMKHFGCVVSKKKHLFKPNVFFFFLTRFEPYDCFRNFVLWNSWGLALSYRAWNVIVRHFTTVTSFTTYKTKTRHKSIVRFTNTVWRKKCGFTAAVVKYDLILVVFFSFFTTKTTLRSTWWFYYTPPFVYISQWPSHYNTMDGVETKYK